MSQSYTYDELNAALRTWNAEDETEFAAEIPSFIGKAETRVLRDLNLNIFDLLTTSLATVASTATVAKPDDWVMTRDVWVTVSGSKRRLMEKPLSFILDYNPAAAEGSPLYVNEYSDTQWYVAPVPDAAYTVSCLYASRPTGLTSANQTTWLGTECGDLLHELTMQEAAKFLKQPDKVQLFEAEYQKKLATARLELRSLIRSDFNPTKAGSRAV